MAATRYTRPTTTRTTTIVPARRPNPIDGGTLVLGTFLSLAAALVTVALATFGDVSRWSLVISVTVVGFVSSWVRCGHVAHRRPAVVTVSH